MDKIERHCWFDTIPIHSAQTRYGTLFKHMRARKGHKFLLKDWNIISHLPTSGNTVAFQVYDGYVQSMWGAFPNIYDQSMIGAYIVTAYEHNAQIDLGLWECKEFTLSVMSDDTDDAVQFGSIIRYYLVPMSKLETLEYAVKQPRYKYRKGFARTADVEEGGGYG